MATQFDPTLLDKRDAPDSSYGEAGSIVELIRRLTRDLSTLFRQEIALASAEISRSLSTLAAAAAAVAISGAVLFGATLALLASIVLALANVMPPWLAALTVAVVAGIAGFVMLRVGLRKMKPSLLVPTQSQESLRRDKDVLTRKAS